MGFGNVAVGEAMHPDDKVPGIIYLPIHTGARAHNADCADIYPKGSSQSDYLAVVYFYSPDVLQQTIDVLLDMQRSHVWGIKS